MKGDFISQEERELRYEILKYFRGQEFKLDQLFLKSDCYWSGYFLYWNSKDGTVKYQIEVSFAPLGSPNRRGVYGILDFEEKGFKYTVKKSVPLDDYRDILSHLYLAFNRVRNAEF